MVSVIATIHQCMQRGERPLSVVDLIEKNLLTVNQAAWLVSRIEGGSSWLTGAIPSHAGKTTLMSALLAFLPSQEQATLAHPGMQWAPFGPGSCVVAEEISPHGPPGYLWSEDVRQFTVLPGRGACVAATLHATDLEQVREQIARQCAAGESGVAAFGVFIPIEVEFAPEPAAPEPAPPSRKRHRPIASRSVDVIHYHHAGQWHAIDRDVRLQDNQSVIADFLRLCRDREIRSCEAVRTAWLGIA